MTPPLPSLSKLDEAPNWRAIAATGQAIARFVHRTPVLRCASLDEISGARLFFKCENFQKVGAFKMRGAASATLRLCQEERERGLATHSSGNHAQAVARSAQLFGVPSYIVMPENAPAIKRAATQSYSAEIIPCAPTLEAREQTLEQVVEKTGATFIHPYDHYDIIAGQGTAAWEFMEDAPILDTIMAPVGGGGLISGTALYAKGKQPAIEVIGAEPAAVDDAHRSFMSGEIVHNTTIDTIADGLRTNLGRKNFAIMQRYLDDILTVEEDEIVWAMRLIWERMKIIIEPSCAVPFAAVLRNPGRFKGKKVGIILTGGNVDLHHLPFSRQA